MFLDDSLACKSSTGTATKTFFLFSSGDLASLARAFLMISILLLLSANAVFAWSEAEFEYMKQATSEPHVNTGMANLECKHYKDAINEFTAAIKENPKNGFAYSGRAEALMGLGRFSEALPDIEYALSIRPLNFEFLGIHAQICRHLHRYAEAISDYNKILLEVDPVNKYTLLDRANTFLIWKKYQEALGDFDRYLLELPDNADALYGRAITNIELARADLLRAEKRCVNSSQLPLKRKIQHELKHLVKQGDSSTM